MSKKSQSAISLNIAIIPDGQTTNQAIELSQKVSLQIETEFVLNQNNLLPHITVYQAHFPVKNLEKIKTAVRSITSKTKPFTVSVNNFSISHETFLFWNCVKTDSFVYLQKEIIAKINHLRNGLILPILSKITGLSEADKEDINRYGSLLIDPRYQPHITITRLGNPKDSKKALEILGSRLKADFIVNRLIVGYLGDHGTVIGVIEEFSFL